MKQPHFLIKIKQATIGPWARYVDEKTVAKPDPELQKEMDEIVRKRQLKSKAGKRAAMDEQQLVEETTTLHCKFKHLI